MSTRIPSRRTFTWEGASERLDRLAAANRRATREYLQSLTPEESIAIFEDLSRGIPELDRECLRSDHPIALCKIWRD